MKTNRLITGILFLLLSAGGAIAFAQDVEDFDAQELIRQIETQYQGKTSKVTLRMKIVTEAWSRDMTMESWS